MSDDELLARAADLVRRMAEASALIQRLETEYAPLQTEILTRGLGDELLRKVANRGK